MNDSLRASANALKAQQIEELYRRSKGHFPEVPDLSVDEFERLRQHRQVVLVDVRKPKEQRVSMLPNAITSRQFEADREQYRGQTVVAYCTIGHRSGLYTRSLIATGWEAFNLRGAILAWTHSGHELVSDDGPTRRVHVAGPRWNLAADGYEGVW